MRNSHKPFLVLLEVAIAIGIPAVIGVLYSYIQLQEIKTFNVEAKYEECIVKAGRVIRISIFAQEAQGLINECLAGYAQKLAAEGKFAEAIAVAANIPKNSPLYPEVQKRIQEWKEN